MTQELFWLVLTIIMTGLLWVPYMIDRIMVRGIEATVDNPGPNAVPQSPWAQRLMAARAQHPQRAHRHRLRALFRVTTGPRGHLRLGRAAVSHPELPRLVGGADHPGAVGLPDCVTEKARSFMQCPRQYC